MTADFTTVFEISHWSNGLLREMLFHLAIGVAALGGGLRGLYLMWRRPDVVARRNVIVYLFMTGWGVMWIVMHDFPAMFGRINGLASAYEHGRCEWIEGDVQVQREQPVHGHSSGDRIRVDGREFEVNYFYATSAYRQTISHGGALRSGAHVRICHVDGALVRVDVAGAPAGK